MQFNKKILTRTAKENSFVHGAFQTLFRVMLGLGGISAQQSTVCPDDGHAGKTFQTPVIAFLHIVDVTEPGRF